jgi:flagellar hook-basal body complex protein FliE
MSIAPITSTLAAIPHIPLTAVEGTTSAGNFGQILQSTIGQVEQNRQIANDAIGKFLSGEQGELHSTVLAAQKSDLQFDLFLQVRNKVVNAYQEIMRMQL